MDYSSFKEMLTQLTGICNEKGEPAAFSVLHTHLEELSSLRATLTPEEESRHIDAFRRSCHYLILQSEFNYYVFTRPRGYPGDFMTQELIWNGRTIGGQYRYKGVSRTGELLTSLTLDMAAPRANEERMVRLAKLVREGRNRSVASIGAGSAIEYWGAEENIPDTIFLLDQDELALARAKQYGRFGDCDVKYCKENIVKFILRNSRCLHLGARDLIYSFGLLDYFPVPMAKRIIEALWVSVNSGGRLLVTNAHPGTSTRIWMEWGGEWYLNYKTEDEMLELAEGLEGVASVSCDMDTQHVYQYLTIEKE